MANSQSAGRMPDGGEDSNTEGDRLYKACRTCRRQKMRCSGYSPCERCQRTGVPCVFERATGRKRKLEPEGSGKSGRLDAMEREIAVLKSQMAQLQGPPNSGLQPFNRSGPQSHIETAETTLKSSMTAPNTTKVVNGDHLTPTDLEAPVTAVHVMMYPSPMGEAQRNAQGWSAENQSKWNRQDESSVLPYEDLLARSSIEQPLVRSQFDSFMASANSFLHIFDPALDTFDAVRVQSSFIFTVILYLAARQQPQQKSMKQFTESCLLESNKFAARSLFQNPSSLETVQAMAALAVYSNKTWFALGHAFQMGLDLGLDYRMRSIISESSPKPGSRECTRFDSRCACTWLMIVYYERSLAVASARPARSEPLGVPDLQKYASHKLVGPGEVFLCASIDLFQRFGKLKGSTHALTEEEVEADLDSWWALWTTCFDTHRVHAQSFQRVHLRVMMLYVRMIEIAIVTSRSMLANRTSHNPARQHRESSQISEQCMEAICDLLNYINECDAYKQLFKWSPTFEALLLTYAIILGFRILRSHHFGSEKKSSFMPLAQQAAAMLKQHPCSDFHTVVEALLQHDKTGSQAPGPVSVSDGSVAYAADLDSIWQNIMSESDDLFEGLMDINSISAEYSSTVL